MDITSPTLLLDKSICQENIKQMAEKARSQGLDFKPHMKTHQSNKIAKWFKDEGVKAITVSSVRMANYFAKHGWNEITIAFPCNVCQIEQINHLAKAISLTVLINNQVVAQQIDQQLSANISAYIEIDTGSNRTGIPSDNLKKIKELITVIQNTDHISWKGFYSHPGHSYSARSPQEILDVHHSVLSQFQRLKNKLTSYQPFEVCIGDTPCCSVANNFEGIDAISPGNFVFYDLMQTQIGSCSPTQVAVAMVCPIVDKYASRNELVIHGGAVHFSKESMVTNGISHYGLVADYFDDGWKPKTDQSMITKLSQEHGTISCSDHVLESYSIGDTITVLPVHSCLTANLMGEFSLGNGARITMM